MWQCGSIGRCHKGVSKRYTRTVSSTQAADAADRLSEG